MTLTYEDKRQNKAAMGEARTERNPSAEAKQGRLALSSRARAPETPVEFGEKETVPAGKTSPSQPRRLPGVLLPLRHGGNHVSEAVKPQTRELGDTSRG